MTARIALVLNAVGYLVSGVLISRVKVPERHRSAAGSTSVFAEARLGVAVLLGRHVLRALVTEASIWNFGNEVLTIALPVLLLGDYGYGQLILGLILMALGVGAFVGSIVSQRLTARFGYGRSLIVTLLLGNTAPVAGVLAASAPGWSGMVGLAVTLLISGFGIGVASNQAVSLRQLATSSKLRGRVDAG